MISSNFDGLTHSSSGCVCANIPQANSAVGTSDIVEVVDAELAVYTKAGAHLMSTTLNSLLGTTNVLAFPRIIFDPLWNRFVLSVEGLPPTAADYAQIWTLVSLTGDPTGSWYVFHQSIFWAGVNGVADYPTIGMDRDSILVASNNYAFNSGTSSYDYSSTTAYAIPKAIIYNSSNSWTSVVFFMAFGGVPAIVTGNPTPDVLKVYFLAVDLTAGVIHTYSLSNSAHFGRQVFKSLADVAYAYIPAPRRVNQPGTAVTLDPGDGRITGAPSQVDLRVWFADTVNLLGYPSVKFGYVTVSATPTIRVASAYHSGTSDDFNPALAVVNDAAGAPNMFLTWAYTDTLNSIPVHETWDKQRGANIVNKTGSGYSPTGVSTPTGEMGTVASAAIDYTPPCGISAVLTGQYFAASGGWRSRIAEVGVC